MNSKSFASPPQLADVDIAKVPGSNLTRPVFCFKREIFCFKKICLLFICLFMFCRFRCHILEMFCLVSNFLCALCSFPFLGWIGSSLCYIGVMASSCVSVFVHVLRASGSL